MARQQSQSKLLYYPTPLDTVVNLIATWISAGENNYLVRLADPCVGEGLALRRLSDLIPASKKETWGVEISQPRALKAEKVIDVVLPAALSLVAWEPKSVSLIFNNPPYDWSDQIDSDNKRLRYEEVFLFKTRELLVNGGIQVYIVPDWMLAREGAARHWLGWYENTQLFRFPDGEFEAFGQVVLIGQKRTKYAMATKEALEAFMANGLPDAILPAIYEGDGRFVLPKAPAFARFSFSPMDGESIARRAWKINPLGSIEWERSTYVRPVGAAIYPLVQLKIGHLSMLISGGELGVVGMNDMLVKGTLNKVVRRDTTDILDNDGHKSGVRIEEVESLQSVITTIGADGTKQVLNGTQQVADFITSNAGPLADAVLAHNKPFYDWQPTLPEWTQAGKSALGLPPLPGRIERGLFDVQKHFAIAAARFMKNGNKAMKAKGWKHVLMNAEMGWGKSPGTVATLEQLNKWPAVVMCPGHMVFKWMVQLRDASDQDSPIGPRVITKPARAEASWLHTDILPILAKYLGVIERDERWQVEPTGDKDSGLRRRLTIKAMAKGSYISHKKADGSDTTEHVPNLRLALLSVLAKRVEVRENAVPVKKSLTSDGFTVEFMDRDDYTMADFYDDATFGRLGKKPVAVIAFEPAKYDAGARALELKKSWIRAYSAARDHYVTVRVPICPGCGKPFGVVPKDKETYQSPDGKKRWELILYKESEEVELIDLGDGRYEMTPDVEIPQACPHKDFFEIKDEAGKVVMQGRVPLVGERPCKTILYEMSRWRRIGLSRLVQRQYKHWFKVYVADEIHEMKSPATDIGTADGRFISSIEHSLALTGTIFGGTASSLFPLLYRRNPEVRHHYAYKEGRTLWVDHFGLWRYRWSQKDSGQDYSRGLSSNIKRWDVRPPQELPGFSPALVRFLLPLTLFGKITDLGYVLPPLHDVVNLVAMGTAQQKQYDETNEVLLKMALKQIKEHKDSSMLATWFTTVRFRPMSAFRVEYPTWKEKILMRLLPALDGGKAEPEVADGIKWLNDQYEFTANVSTLPKELRLAQICGENTRLGRKTLVFVEQTGTRDIRERLVEVIQNINPSIRVQTLSSDDMKPSKREMWIKRNAPEMDVMLVNAGLVKTGLDLVMFSDIVFFETNTSLYTVWQAMRRVWRLGQKNAVHTTFLAYAGTMEESLLDRMGKKMKAAMLLYGDSASGALVDSDGDDDIAREIIRAALQGKTIENAGAINGKSIFGSGDEHAVLVSNSPMGSPMAQTPQLVMLAHVALAEPEPIAFVDLMQMGLFGGMTVAVAPSRRKRR